MPDPYAVDAPFYDLIHGSGGDDIGLWLSFAGRTDRPVLEVGTGTGRIALELARAGHAVVGVDPSGPMLTIARGRAEDDALDVQFIEGAVGDLALEPGHYGFVLVPADVFLYCADGEAQLAMLRALRTCLTYNGTLAIDLPGPALWLDSATNGQALLVHSIEEEDGTLLDVWQRERREPRRVRPVTAQVGVAVGRARDLLRDVLQHGEAANDPSPTPS